MREIDRLICGLAEAAVIGGMSLGDEETWLAAMERMGALWDELQLRARLLETVAYAVSECGKALQLYNDTQKRDARPPPWLGQKM